MFEEWMTRSFYGNSVAEWAVAAGIVIGAVMLGKILYWVSTTYMRRLTEKTETKLDDIIIDMIEEPIVLATSFAGIWFGLSTLTLPDWVVAFNANVFQALIVLSGAWLVTRVADAMYEMYLVPLAEKSENDLDDQLLPILRRGTRLAIWLIGAIVALNNAGYDVGALIAGLGIGGIALAMAAKDTISNIFGGYTIFTDRPFTLHDRVKVAGYDGIVTEIGIRSTRIRTLENRIVTIPNMKFADAPVENVSAEPSRKVGLELGLTYDTTPEQMEKGMDLLRSIALEHESIDDDDIRTGFSAFGDSAMVITFVYFIKKDGAILGTQSDVNMSILKKFAAEGLDFAFPTQTLYTIPVAAAEANG